VKLGLHLPSERASKEILRSARQHGFEPTTSPADMHGYLKVFKDRLRAKVRQVPSPQPFFVKFGADPTPFAQHYAAEDGPCGIPMDPTLTMVIPSRRRHSEA